MESKNEQEVRRSIQQMLRRVPEKVCNGSYDISLAYKKAAGQAAKVATNPRSSLAQLMQARSEISSFN